MSARTGMNVQHRLEDDQPAAPGTPTCPFAVWPAWRYTSSIARPASCSAKETSASPSAASAPPDQYPDVRDSQSVGVGLVPVIRGAVNNTMGAAPARPLPHSDHCHSERGGCIGGRGYL
jgi:hypothetical protein